MNLLPTDLGLRRCVSVVRAVVTPGGLHQSAPSASIGDVRPIGTLGRWWLRGLNLDDASGAAILAAVRPATIGMVGGMAGGFGGGFGGPAIGMLMGAVFGHDRDAASLAVVGSLFGALGLSGIVLGLSLPRTMLRRTLGTPLSEAHIDRLLASAEDDLERRYLTLVRDAVRIESAPEKVIAEVRAAIATLGQALDSLPANAKFDDGLDGDALRSEAEAVRARGLAEPDAVVSDSLLRRADALERQAEALGHSAQAIRRAAALRDELSAQIDALRLGLSAYYSGYSGGEPADPERLTRLASSARAVATEAGALALARAELDAPEYPIIAVRR